MTNSPVRATINLIRRCQQMRDAGEPVAFTTDPTWLVNMAINRRAGWPDDPSGWRGSAMPVNGHYPHKAEGQTMNHLRLIAGELNTPRLRVYASQLGEWRKLVLGRLA